MLRSLHLDLVELLSTDLDASTTAIEQFGEQVRQVSRGVDALATALDEVVSMDAREREQSVSPATAPPRDRTVSPRPRRERS